MEIGCPWTTEEFVELALRLKHPFDSRAKVPPAVAKAMTNILRLGPTEIAARRKATIDKWTRRRDELVDLEKILKDKLHPDVKKIVANKNILLFREMLMSIGYDDLAVVDMLTMGVKVVGELERTGFWQPDPTKAPKLSMRSLWAGAREAQEDVLRGLATLRRITPSKWLP